MAGGAGRRSAAGHARRTYARTPLAPVTCIRGNLRPSAFIFSTQRRRPATITGTTPEAEIDSSPPGHMLGLVVFGLVELLNGKPIATNRKPPSQGRKTFLRNHPDGIASMDLFVVPTISFQLLYGLLILKHGLRKILCLVATAHPSADWISRQLTEATKSPAPNTWRLASCKWTQETNPLMR
jgi:hypothetical protein